MSRTANGAPARAAASGTPLSSARTSGCTIASSCCIRSGRSSTAAPRFGDRPTPSATVPGNACVDQRRGAPAIERVHGRIGVVNRNAEAPKNIAAAVDLPMPIEPVRPRTKRHRRSFDIGRRSGRVARASPSASRRTSARSPAPPDAAACRARRRCAMPLGARLRSGAASRAARRRCRRRRRPRGRPARSNVERRLARHAERGGVDEERRLREASPDDHRRPRPPARIHRAGARTRASSAPCRRCGSPRTMRVEAALLQSRDDALAPRRRRRARAHVAHRLLPAVSPGLHRGYPKAGDVGVVAAERAVLDPKRVDRRTPLAPARCVWSASAKAASLCGIVTLPPAKAAAAAKDRRKTRRNSAAPTSIRS